MPKRKDPPTCQERYWNGHEFVVCGRTVREDGLCGIHLRSRNARKESQERQRTNLSKSREGKELATSLCAELKDLGIVATPYYFRPPGTGLGQYTGGIAIEDPSHVEKLIDQIKRSRND